VGLEKEKVPLILKERADWRKKQRRESER